MRKKLLYLVLILAFSPVFAGQNIDSILDGSHRSEANKQRDQYRHPKETLEFFDVRGDMTIVEIWPGKGWYTEVLAPLSKGSGTLYAAHFDKNHDREYFQKSRAGFEKAMVENPDQYGEVKLAEFNPSANLLTVPEGAADRVLTFRNVHNWLRSKSEQQAFALFYKALKPGGMLGVVEHGTKSPESRDWMLKNGYMNQDYVVELAEKAGFKLHKTSLINSNALDNNTHPKGVWTLPPSLRMGDEDRQKYLDIGESNRMTLLFIKPAN